MSKAAKVERVNFGRLPETVEMPNLIEVQLDSYRSFLQEDVAPKNRKNYGLQAVFREVFPIESYDEKIKLDFSHYELGTAKQGPIECLREGVTFAAPLYVTFALHNDRGARLYGRTPADDSPGNVHRERCRAGHRQPTASFPGHLL
jgi:DNA-directed RNA polymerase subunit beta